MATSEGIPSSIDIEFLELNDNPYIDNLLTVHGFLQNLTQIIYALFGMSVSSS